LKLLSFKKIMLIFLRILGIALLSLTAGILIRKYMLNALEDRIVWVTFYPVVVIAAVFGGWLCGVFTALGSCIFAIYACPFFVNKPFIDDHGDWLGLYAFMLNCIMISAVAEMMRIARARANTARKHAESANHAKTMFLANMSHEIRTPMNAVLGFAQLLEKDPSLSPEARNKVATILKSGEHLLSIINDVLEMSRIEAGRVALSEQTIDLWILMEDLTVMFRMRAEEKGLTFSLHIAKDLPRYIVADMVKLRQILINLLGNAVKFTSTGTIEFRAVSVSNDRIAIEVQDTGIGISLDEQKDIFRPFERTQIGEQTSGGTGLGLAISRNYAHLMGGEITIESGLKSGSCFRFEFHSPSPAILPVFEKSIRHYNFLAPGQDEIRVLVVDDTMTNRDLLREFLEPIGFVVDEACNGNEAIEKVASHAPRVILMDLVMPGMNGIEAIRSIRKNTQDGSIAIIGISASAFEDDKRLFLKVGANAFLAKPFKQQELLALIAHHADVKFEMESIQKEISSPTPIIAELNYSELPVETLQELKNAAECLDKKRVREIVARINKTNPDLGRGIEKMISEFRFDQIVSLCQNIFQGDPNE